MFYIDYSDIEQNKHKRDPEIHWSHMLGFKYCNIEEDRLKTIWQHCAFYPWLLSNTSWVSFFIFCITAKKFLLISQIFTSIQWWIFSVLFIDTHHNNRILFSFEAAYRIYMAASASISFFIMMYSKLGSSSASCVMILQMGWEFYTLSLESLPFPYYFRLMAYISISMGYIIFLLCFNTGLFDNAFDRSIFIEISWLNFQLYPSSILSSAILNSAIFAAKSVWGLVKHPHCSIFLSEPQHIDYLSANWIISSRKSL